MTRIYVVGTDTGVGKTAVTCALLRQARTTRLRWIPYKPAQSGNDEPTDTQRLLRAAGLSPTDLDAMCPFQYPDPIAPGLADSMQPFLRPLAANHEHSRHPVLDETRRHLARWEEQHHPDHVLIEGAGGLHVPMPLGTWQLEWIRALAKTVVLVGRSGLGTINHTLLTIDACRHAKLNVLGFYLCDVDVNPDPSTTHNAQVIAAARNIDYLGTLEHQVHKDQASQTDLLSPLIRALQAFNH